jgi:hypothetical protein
MKIALVAALFFLSLPALADQQCQFYGNQVVCRDVPGYRDAQVDARIPLMRNGGYANQPIAMYQPMDNQAAVAGAAVLMGALFRGIGYAASSAYQGIKNVFVEPYGFCDPHLKCD